MTAYRRIFRSSHVANALTLLALAHSATKADEFETLITVPSMTTALIQHAEIAAREPGILKSLSVKPGDSIAEGQILATLDDELQEIAVQQAELNVQIAQLKADTRLPVETARAMVREAEQEKAKLEIVARISQKQAESDVAVRLAVKNKDVAKYELDRAQKAKESFSGSISNSELNRLTVLFDQRSLEIEKAEEDRAIGVLKPEADLAAVQQQAEAIARTQSVAAEKEQEQQVARANLEVAKSELAEAKLQLQRRRLKAPFAATVVSVSRQPGEWLEPGSVVLRLIQLDRLRVEGFVSADQAILMEPGLPARIVFPGNVVKPVSGEITFISPEVEPVNQQVRIWAEFDNPEKRIRPGLVTTMEVKSTKSNPVEGETQKANIPPAER
ncbi:MAG: HlyD family efflux transporter periplasmic adaptor subunit [Planctomycetaceae bacterium]